jgi:hypothetical protein
MSLLLSEVMDRIPKLDKTHFGILSGQKTKRPMAHGGKMVLGEPPTSTLKNSSDTLLRL